MSSPAPVKPEVSLEDLNRLDIRVGTIREVADVSASKNLVKLRVDFGDHSRTILSGMKGEREDLGKLVGLQALFLVNLAARPMAGEVSEGMLLDIGYADGIAPALAVPERAVPDGARVG